MNDLLKKLNVLVKSTIHDALSDGSRRESLTPARLGKGIDGEIDQLRQKINDALSYEDQLQSRVQSLQTEIDKWDKQADRAVAAENDAQARYAVEQMQRGQQRLTMAESDLREHQLVTQELIMRVNTLDAVVADAHRAENEKEADQPEAPASRSVLSEALRDVREKISPSGEKSSVEMPEPAVEPPADDAAVEDDLSKRRKRLSKPE